VLLVILNQMHNVPHVVQVLVYVHQLLHIHHAKMDITL